MPLVSVEIPQGRPAGYGTAIGDAVPQALNEALGVPPAECFQVITAPEQSGLPGDPGCLGIGRNLHAITVQVFVSGSRDTASKQGFYSTLTRGLQEGLGLCREDLVASIVEIHRRD